jgi:molybdopterin-guanine dinucleotide biosynthesis protein B
MKVIGFSGYSGSGKTTLVEQLIVRLRLAGQRVSVVKHAHHDFDIDHPGKDSHRHREAGAFEVVIASDRRLAKIREFEVRADPTVHQLIAELYECLDDKLWVLVEGFKHADVLKIEVWRAETGKPVQYPNDPYVVAISTDSPQRLPEPTGLPLLDLNDPDAVIHFLLADPDRYEYRPPFELAGPGPAADADAGRGAEPAARRDPPAG